MEPQIRCLIVAIGIVAISALFGVTLELFQRMSLLETPIRRKYKTYQRGIPISITARDHLSASLCEENIFFGDNLARLENGVQELLQDLDTFITFIPCLRRAEMVNTSTNLLLSTHTLYTVLWCPDSREVVLITALQEPCPYYVQTDGGKQLVLEFGEILV
jgi:hypothetical protein